MRLSDLPGVKVPIIERFDSQESEALACSSQLDFHAAVRGPFVNDKVAEIANILCQLRITQEQRKSIMKRDFTPDNVKVPLYRSDHSVWNEIPGKTRRINDIKFQPH